MAERPNNLADDLGNVPADQPEQQPARARRSPDALNLAMALISLVTAGMVLTDWAPPFDPRWLLAGGAMLIGLVLLVASTRPARGDGPRR